MANEKEKENVSLEAKAENFFIKTKYLWISLIGAALIALIVVGVVAGVTSSAKNKSVTYLEDAIYKYESSKASMDAASAKSAEDELISTLKAYTEKKGKNKNTIRYYMTIASIYSDRSEWELALENWLTASKCAPSSYLAGIADFNAASCYENLSDLDSALKFYEKAASNKKFDLKAHALFNQARVLEAKAENDKALEVYTKIVDAYADDSWADLAKSRIIYLNSNK